MVLVSVLVSVLVLVVAAAVIYPEEGWCGSGNIKIRHLAIWEFENSEILNLEMWKFGIPQQSQGSQQSHQFKFVDFFLFFFFKKIGGFA